MPMMKFLYPLEVENSIKNRNGNSFAGYPVNTKIKSSLWGGGGVTMRWEGGILVK